MRRTDGRHDSIDSAAPQGQRNTARPLDIADKKRRWRGNPAEGATLLGAADISEKGNDPVKNDRSQTIPSALVLFMMLMSMTGGAMCLNKVAPIIPLLIRDMGLSGAGQAGLLISVFVFSGIFLAIPSGMIIEKLGYYRTGIVALGTLLVGSLPGVFDPGYVVMLVSRVIEGIGLILLMTLGPAVTARVFSDEKRASAMGLLMCFMAFGQIAMFNLAPRIATAAGWKTIWWITLVYAVLFLLIWIALLRNLDATLSFAAPAPADAAPSGAPAQPGLLPREVFLNKGVWLVSLTLMIYLIAEQGVISFLPTFLNEVRGMDAAEAGSIISVAPLVGIPVGIIVGIISAKLGSRKWPLGILMLASAVTYGLMPSFPTGLFLVLVILFGVAVMGIVGLCFAAVAELVQPRHGNMAVALLNTFQWVGIFLSSTLVGLLIEWFGWDQMFYLMVPLTVIGALCTFITPKLR